jgi:hypothetical protein
LLLILRNEKKCGEASFKRNEQKEIQQKKEKKAEEKYSKRVPEKEALGTGKIVGQSASPVPRPDKRFGKVWACAETGSTECPSHCKQQSRLIRISQFFGR